VCNALRQILYTFSRIGAVLKMRVEDVYVQGRRTWMRLHEKGGKQHTMPCHHSLEAYLEAYIDAAHLAGSPKAPLFRTCPCHADLLTESPMTQPDAYRMIRRGAAEAASARALATTHSAPQRSMSSCAMAAS
jgi:integrase